MKINKTRSAENWIYFMAAECCMLKNEGIKYHLQYWRDGHIYALYNRPVHIRIKGRGSRSWVATVDMIQTPICGRRVDIW